MKNGQNRLCPTSLKSVSFMEQLNFAILKKGKEWINLLYDQ